MVKTIILDAFKLLNDDRLEALACQNVITPAAEIVHWKRFQGLHFNIDDYFKERYFGRELLTRTWKTLHEHPTLLTRFPGDNEIFSTDPESSIAIESHCQDVTVTHSQKRFRSTGEEGTARSSISVAKSKKGKGLHFIILILYFIADYILIHVMFTVDYKQCVHCTKLLAPSTRHLPTACMNYAAKQGIALSRPEIPQIPQIEREESSSAEEIRVASDIPTKINCVIA